MRHQKLRAIENDSSLDGYTFYANAVDAQYSHKSGTIAVAVLSVNFGENSVSFLSFIEQDEETRKKHSDAVQEICDKATLWLDGKTLFVGFADKSFIFYTVDLTSIIPEGWELSRYTLMGRSPRNIGVGLNKLGHEKELSSIHILTEDDLRAPEDEACNDDSPHNLNAMDPHPIKCQRKLGHLGEHQMFGPSLNGSWPTGRNGSGGWRPPYGFRTECIHCGFVDAGGPQGKSVCFTCSYWMNLRKDPKLQRFVVGGRHYTAGGGGGFGGEIFEIEVLNTGKKIKTGLWGQGNIPEHFTELFPDNARFVNRTYFP